MPKRSLSNRREVERLNQAVEEMLRSKSEGFLVSKKYAKLAPMLEAALALRALPREDFKATLKKNLERSAAMATTVEPIAAAHTVAMPRLTFKHAGAAIDFYSKAFGAKELFRFEVGESIAHAEIEIGDSILTLSEEWPEGGRYSAETLGQSPIQISLRVADVDAFAARAIAAGLKVVNPVRDQFYGRREGSFVDPFGYTWNLATVTEDMPVEEMYRRFHAMMPPKKKPAVPPVPAGYRTITPYIMAQDADALIDFVKSAFGAEVTFSTVGGQGGRHAELRLGDSMMMIGGGGSGLNWHGVPHPGAFHVYVRDCDAVYSGALEAGAVSLMVPANQPYGERGAAVKDAAGNHWYIATRLEGDYKWEGASDVQPYLHPLRAEPVIGFLKRAFGAEELNRFALPDGVIKHVTMKVGNSYLEMGEAQGLYHPMATMLYLYVKDCDEMYRRAVAAGATSVMEPTDHPYGDRSGAVRDAFGNEWWIATHIKDVTA